eukprot:4651679-Prymnesium_polylepis.2
MDDGVRAPTVALPRLRPTRLHLLVLRRPCGTVSAAGEAKRLGRGIREAKKAWRKTMRRVCGFHRAPRGSARLCLQHRLWTCLWEPQECSMCIHSVHYERGFVGTPWRVVRSL